MGRTVECCCLRPLIVGPLAWDNKTLDPPIGRWKTQQSRAMARNPNFHKADPKLLFKEAIGDPLPSSNKKPLQLLWAHESMSNLETSWTSWNSGNHWNHYELPQDYLKIPGESCNLATSQALKRSEKYLKTCRSYLKTSKPLIPQAFAAPLILEVA